MTKFDDAPVSQGAYMYVRASDGSPLPVTQSMLGGGTGGSSGFAEYLRGWHMKREVILALGCLLLGFGAGMVSRPPILEQREPLAPTATVKRSSSGGTGFARAACLGTELGDGRWGYVYGGDEC